MSDFLITNLELTDSYKASGKERHAFAILSSTEWISGPIPVFFFFFHPTKISIRWWCYKQAGILELSFSGPSIQANNGRGNRKRLPFSAMLFIVIQEQQHGQPFAGRQTDMAPSCLPTLYANSCFSPAETHVAPRP